MNTVPKLDPRAVELLRKVQQHLRDFPHEYNQNLICGTPCCIVGLAAHILGIPFTIFDDCVEEFFLTREQFARLFWASDWPKKFFKGRPHRVCDIPASVAIDRLDHFIATDGEE